VTPPTKRRRLRRFAVVGVVVLQLALVVRAYDADHAFFGFQMFPESSTWRADIVRVEADGSEHDIREPWPGGYRWGDLVDSRGLSSPWSGGHADAGIRSTLHFLDEALDWVAANTPDDTETVRLVARVTYERNDEPPVTTVLESVDR
jgi:hypothetical protein